LKYIPLLGQYWEYAGNLFIDRDNREKAIKQLERARKLVQENDLTIWIFPEGHRNEKPKILPFKKGAFHMAFDMNLPILPRLFFFHSS
jgi:1-acyl-sn-glycerol-3-phosphate acyltransferase